ncbi:MAG: Protein ElaA [Candidatus Celerinatantimonas neptuna]|nr:MAG: Protein ElaA [Candidatus Celerinatantimonas neptuna]
MLTWTEKYFNQLSNYELYQLMKLRVDVFVVEQQCPYPELDNHDYHPDLIHLLGFRGDELVAYARIIPAGLTYPTPSIGRVITSAAIRGQGIGQTLLEHAIASCQHHWPNQPITIGAQYHLMKFYQNFGFAPTGEPYLEDGIRHIKMQCRSI